MDRKKQFIEGSNSSSPRRLPVFRGYTIDVKLSEFRKVKYGKAIEFVPFSSEHGIKLLLALSEEGIEYNPSTGELERI